MELGNNLTDIDKEILNKIEENMASAPVKDDIMHGKNVGHVVDKVMGFIKKNFPKEFKKAMREFYYEADRLSGHETG